MASCDLVLIFLLCAVFGAHASWFGNLWNTLDQGHSLQVGEYLKYDDFIFGVDKRCFIYIQDTAAPLDDENMGLLWTSFPAVTELWRDGCRVTLLPNGNLVLSTSSIPVVWASGIEHQDDNIKYELELLVDRTKRVRFGYISIHATDTRSGIVSSIWSTL